MASVSNPINPNLLAKYTFVETIYQGSRTTVYRAVETATRQPVVIKVLAQEYPSFSNLVQFRNQYTVAKNLAIAGIVHPFSLELCGNGYALVMEDFGGIDLGHYVQQHSLELTEILGIAIQLADILHELHQHRVIHKDIKPANILIHPDTQQIKLIDFSIASLLPQETQAIQSPSSLEGTLAYLAPEQTGRMNRGIDYRTDFYALGVTLYQLFTGQLPFTSNDPMALIHCHMAQAPVPPHDIRRQTSDMLRSQGSHQFPLEAPNQDPKPRNLNPPLPLSNIILKLMAKNAEDRYQSALGLKHDLEYCLSQWQAQGEIRDFDLGQRDVCDRFLIPEKLYGREQEVQALLDAFERVADSHCEMMLVAGFSGIGKTAVINEVHKPIVRQRGYFIKGKFDQFNRNIPFSAFVQAFRSLMGQLLSESDAQLQQWQAQILQAVGDNGQVLIDVIPELEQIIGPQSVATPLAGSAAQNRFNLLFQKFIAVFTTPEHPLVLFLDDLQWADSASLNLINVLMGSGETSYLLLLGAYRDNEVFPAHPLMLTLSELEQNRATISTLTLAPLASSHINQLVAETLNCSPELAHPLTELVHQKTQGNPFFATQFLTGLYEDNLITFNLNVGYWECDLARVRDAALTDDVVEFMVGRLQKLSEATQVGLKLAACIGNQFDLATLAVVCESHQDEVATQLWSALQEGLILPISEAYKFFQGEIEMGSAETTTVMVVYRFLHDRVQQAAYSLIPDDQRAMAHYRIGQRLLQQTPVQEREERIFAIVGQLNYGADHIHHQGERDELARLNLIACRKARAATAYQAGFTYANTGLALLGHDAWQHQYDMALAFHTLAAELASLGGDLDAMERFIESVIEQAHTLLEKVDVYQLRIQANISQNKLTEAIAIGQQLLAKLDIALPTAPMPSDIQQAMAEIGQLIEGQDIAALIQLPVMTDAKKIAIMQIINSIMPPAYISGSLLHPLVVALSVKLSVLSGNTVASAFGYVNYGIIACNLNRDINSGTQFGQLALQVVSNLNARTAKSVILFVVGQFILHRKSHIKETLSIQKEGYATALEVGNLEYVGYCAQAFCFQAFWCGQPLTNLEAETRAYCHTLKQLNQLTTASWCQIYWQPILNLTGASEHQTLLAGAAFQEAERLPQLMANHDAFGLYFFHLYKLMLCYLFADYISAPTHSNEIRKYFKAGAGTVGEPAFYFYDSLTILAVCESASLDSVQSFQQVDENQTYLQNDWAHDAPMNHQHKVDLVAAEKNRVLGQKLAAIELYDLAIAGAKANEYLQEEALANELAAKFYLDWGKEKVAAGYLQEAYYCYARWGAKAKVADLETRYPELLQPILQPPAASGDVFSTLMTIAPPTISSTQTSSSSTSLNQALDFASILKASQALSGNIELDELLCQLTQIILQNSGGDRCALILPDEHGNWQVRALATPDATQLCTAPLNEHPQLPIKLIHYVKNTQTVVVINDLDTDLPIVDDYLRNQQPKSVLALPILNQGNLIGVLHLENQLASGAFTQESILILNFLCTQAAISLENARLYQTTQETNLLLNSLLLTMPDFFFAKDPLGRYMIVNDNLANFFGCPRDEIIGKTDDDLFPSEIAEQIKIKDQTILNQGITDCFEEVIPINGEDQIYLTIKTPLKNDQGRIVGLIALTRNITQRKQAEETAIQKSQELEKVLSTLKNTQLQMVQSEKMATLGNLVAGVAHEVNNPIGFLNGSINNAKDYVQDLFTYLETYQSEYPPNQVMQASAEDLDLDFVLEDLPKLLDSMQGATDRIRGISTSLRTFSRADTKHKVSADVHDGLNSTLLILKYRLKANEQRPAIEVVTDYGDIPEIACFPGQLNQVFMNILANAIDALDEAGQHRSFAEIEAAPHRIMIRTSLENDQVKIAIADNGPGIPEEIRAHIFDHLFTTKVVGKGTGLGLAIAHQIVVETHNGTLEVQSEIAQGAAFYLRLPR